MYTIGQLRKHIEGLDDGIEIGIQQIYNPEYISLPEDNDVVGSVKFKEGQKVYMFCLVVRGPQKGIYDDSIEVYIQPRFEAKKRELGLLERVKRVINSRRPSS